MDFGMPYLLETPTLEDACKLARELRLDFVELNMNFPACGLERLDAGAMLALKKKYGLYFTLHLDEKINPFEFNELVREAWLETIRRSIALAKAIDAPILNMHMNKGVYITLPDRRRYLYDMYNDHYMRAVLALRALCERELAGGDNMISIENTDGFEPYELRAVDTLLQSPCFCLTLDTGHSLCANEVDMPYYERRIDRVKHMHLHDAVGSRCHLALGDGQVDYMQKLRMADECHARVLLEIKTIPTLKASVRTVQESFEA